MAVSDASDTAGIWLATTPANLDQRRLTLAVMGVLLLAFLAAASFANVPFAANNAFIPYIQATMFFGDLITAILVFTQFSILRSHSLLILANGYLFTALITTSHTLAFPGAFAPEGLFGAGLQTAAWLHVIWHLGFPASVIAYAWLKNKDDMTYPSHASVKLPILFSIVVVTGSVLAITLVIIAADKYLPRLFLDRTTLAPLAVYTGWLTAVTCVVAFLSLWMRQHSVLDRWIMIAIFATLLEMIMLSFIRGRFTFGWYAVRFFGVTTSAIVLIALLTETTRLYAKLTVALRWLQRERDNKLTNAEAVVAAIAHEVRQPLAAMLFNAAAGKQFLNREPPNIAKANNLFDQINDSSFRVSEMFENFLSLFGGGNKEHQPVDMNALALEAIQLFRKELDDDNIVAQTTLESELPSIQGNRGQLREVIHNLVRNSIEAMAPTTKRRIISVVTARHDSHSISFSLQDSGPGIAPNMLASIFDPFVTTKATGTGLGLSICKMIIDQHGGKLSASSDVQYGGARFEVTLPIKIAEPSPKPSD